VPAGLLIVLALSAIAALAASSTIAVDSAGAAYLNGYATSTDLAPPAEPTLTDTDPDSPANDIAPEVKGSAEAGTTVRLYTTPDCSDSPVATGTAAVFASPGLTAPVADNSNTIFRATATDAGGNTSACSTSSITYVEAPGWSKAVTLSAAGRSADSPQVSVNPSGDAIFAWERFDGANYRAQARARSRIGVLATTDTLSDAGQSVGSPQAGIDQDGDAVFAWQRVTGTNCPDPVGNPSPCVHIQGRSRSATGTLGAVQNVTSKDRRSQLPRLAVDPAGDAVFTWSRLDGTTNCGGESCYRVQARPFSAAGALGTIQNLSAVGQNAFDPAVAVDLDGDAVIVWQAGGVIQARTLSAAGTLGAIVTLSGAGAAKPHVADDVSGNAVFVWERGGVIETRARSSAGVLSPIETLSDPTQPASGPQLALDLGANAVFTWQRFDGTNSRIQARARTWAGALSAVQTLTATGQDASQPQVGVDHDGDAVLVWKRFDGANYRIQARTRSAAGTLGMVQGLSAAGQSANAPQVGVAAGGNAIAVWTRFDGSNDRVQAASGP
jgi:hypothetical protein